MNLLLIEPDKLLAASLKLALDQAGWQVSCARSAQAAISVLDQAEADVILLEPQLGLHNGIEFLYELRSYADWQEIPIIIHSANRAILDQEFAEAWRQLGVSTLLYKPTTTTGQLIKAVQATSHVLAG